MAKRTIVAPNTAPLKDTETAPRTQSTTTFELPVRKIPDDAQMDFLRLKSKLKAKGIKKLANGNQLSLSGYMLEAALEKLERDLADN